MSLKNCIKKAGDALSAEDRLFLEQELANGSTDIQALDNLQRKINGELNQLAQEIEAAGGEIGTIDPPTYESAMKLSSLEGAIAYAESQHYKTNRALKVGLQERLNALGLDLSKRDAATEAHLVRMGIRDAMFALRDNSDAVGWYDIKMRQALETLSLLHPELKTDPSAKLAFTYALAVTSNGLEVNRNFELAEKAYKAYKATGKMPTNVGEGTAADKINTHLRVFNEMLETYGAEDLSKIMNSRFTVRQLQKVLGQTISGENMTTVVNGAAFLGPKIGNGFFANLNGQFDMLTMDRWLIRTWGRWTGTLIEDKPANVKKAQDRLATAIVALRKNKKQYAAFQELLGMPLDRPVNQLAIAIAKTSVRVDKRQQMMANGTTNEIRLAGNSLAGYLDGQKEDPANGTERTFIRKVFSQVLDHMQRNGYNDMTMADLQALLWYPEKRLYDKAKSAEDVANGYDKDEAPDYANAAVRLVKANGIKTRSVNAALKRAEKQHEASVSARSAGRGTSGRQGVESSQAGREAEGPGFTDRQRAAFLKRNLLVKDRVARSRSDTARSFGKGSRGTLGGVRGLVSKPLPNYANVLADSEVTAEPLVEMESTRENAELFESLIQQSKKASAYGAAVYVYPVERTDHGDYVEDGYEDMRLFVNETQTAGFAIKSDGDIVSVFSAGGGAAYGMLALAVERGGTKLDAFDTVLPEIYEMAGFQEVRREPWDPGQKPKGWVKKRFAKFNNGEPDVVYMEYRPGHIPTFYSQSVYHGSGVSGIQKLETKYVGTGEGNRVFGWGLYFASQEEIGRWYKESVGGRPRLFINDVEYEFDDIVGNIDWEAIRDIRNGRPQKEVLAEIDALAGMLQDDYADMMREMDEIEAKRKALEKEELRMEQADPDDPQLAAIYHQLNMYDSQWRDLDIEATITGIRIDDYTAMETVIKDIGAKQIRIEEGGGLYQVELAPEEHEYLDWNKPLNQQPEFIQERIIQALGKPREYIEGMWDTGGEMYEKLARDLHESDKEASLALHAIGIRGIRYLDAGGRGPGGASYNYVIFHDDDVQIIRQLEQEDRARYFPNLGGQRVIQLTEASDLSSFLHESGHLFLDMQRIWANKYGMNDNQRAMLEWLGVESFDDIRVEHHEKWAETFEVYLREGKAPSLNLRRAFQAFARWLKTIYQTLSDPRLGRAKLDPEITEIFDRLLATQAEIDEAAATPEHTQLYQSKEQAGMTDLQWKKYTEHAQRVKDNAEMKLDQKVLAELKRTKSAEWKAEKRPLIEEEKQRLAKEPIYQLLSDALIRKEGRKVIHDGRIDWHALRDAVGEWPRGKFNNRTVGGGIDPGLYAEAYGFASVKDMYKKVNAAPSLQEAAEQAAEQRMIQKYGDILNDGTLEQEVREAMLNEDQAQMLIMELRAARKKEGWLSELGAPPQSRINKRYLKAQASILVSKMRFKEIRPTKYYHAMVRAAQDAARGKDVVQSKINQIANHYLYRAAAEAKQKMEKHRKRVKYYQDKQYSPKQVDSHYIQAIKHLAMAYDMRLPRKDRETHLMNVLNFYEGQREQATEDNDIQHLQLLDPNLVRAIEYRHENDGALDGFELKGFDDLTAEELEGVVDMLDHLRYVGGGIATGKRGERGANIADGAQQIKDKGGKDYKYQRGQQREGKQAALTWANIVDSFPSIRNMIRRLDGFQDGGWAFENILKPLNDGYARRLEIQERLHDMLEEYMGDISQLGLSLKDAEPYTAESGKEHEFSSEEIFMMTLYWGNESARKAVMDGFELTEQDVYNLMSRLSPDQLKLANGIWAMNESMWPDLADAAKKMLGAAPPKLIATPFQVNGVQMTGGHMQLMYDSQRLELKEEQRKGLETATVVPSRAGSTFARVGSGGAPPMLLISNITQSVEDKAQYIAFAEIGDQLRSLLKNRELTQAIEQKHGPEFYRNLLYAIDAVITERTAQETNRGFAKLNRWMRGNATMMHLAYSIRNVMQQFSAAPIAMREVGVVKYTQASALFAQNPRQMARMIGDKSKFMRNRAQLVNREASEYLRKVVATSKLKKRWNQLKTAAFALQTGVDMTIAYPTWYAAYTTAKDKHGDEKRAIIEADTAVAESVGSGSDMHLGRIMQSNQNEFVKTLTLFGSWFNAYYQRLYKSSKGGTDFMNTAFAIDAVVLPMIAANLAQMLIMDTPDDDEAWWEYVMNNTWQFMVATAPLVRDVASLAKGFTPTNPLVAIPAAPVRLWGETDALIEGRQGGIKYVADVGRVTSSLVPMPGSGNVWRSLDYVDSYMQGKEGKVFNPYQALTEGSDKNK